MSVESILNGTDLFGEEIKRESTGIVSDRFGFPPFSVLDARSGAWQDRKRAWISIGIKSEIGRGEGGRCFGQDLMKKEHIVGMVGNQDDSQTGTSIFDPTLCECMYQWFSPKGAQIVDPFAGGSVRGVVAGVLGRKYWGCDLRSEQITANIEQAKSMTFEEKPHWICGDSMVTLEQAPDADFVFSCPPYGDLEKYSDSPEDLSSMEWHTFKAAYSRIILRAVKKLKQDRFACFVVGDFRDKRGYYRNFVSATAQSFIDCGCELYNEAVLVTSVGSASMRVTKQFESGRKFAKTHQNVLVFCKGDWRKAAQFCNGQ